jgi:hypothetical protein
MQIRAQRQRGGNGGHACGAEHDAVEPAGHRQCLRAGSPQFVSAEIENRKHEGPRSGYQRVGFDQAAFVGQHRTRRWIRGLSGKFSAGEAKNQNQRQHSKSTAHSRLLS